MRYVTALSIDPELIGDDSALGAFFEAKFAILHQQAHADNARPGS
jgi:hypothetical protein